MEDIEGKHRLGAWVLLAENKVNPPTQLTRHKLAFQALSEEGRAIREREEHTTHTTEQYQTDTTLKIVLVQRKMTSIQLMKTRYEFISVKYYKTKIKVECVLP